MKKLKTLLQVLTLIVLMVFNITAITKTTSQQDARNSDFWPHLSSSFHLTQDANKPEVRQQILWFQKHKSYLYELLHNATPYLYYVMEQVRERKLPGELALLPFVESDYNPLAINSSGAAGLWQLMPGTAADYGLTENWWYDGRRDIPASTKAALTYLTYLQTYFGGNWLLAMAAYDSGEGKVQQAVQKNASRGKKVVFWNLDLPHETQSYVPRILALAEIIKHPQHYQVKLPKINNAPYLTTIHVGPQINLSHVAKLADINVKKLYALNPAYNHWSSTIPESHSILMPVDNLQTFKRNYAQFPNIKNPEPVITLAQYMVKEGDSLSLLAAKFKTSSKELRRINHLHSNTIVAGHTLSIPTSTINHSESPHKELALSQTSQQTKTYKVVEGDSLSIIAHNYHVSVSALKKLNHLHNDVLQLAMVLKIPESKG